MNRNQTETATGRTTKSFRWPEQQEDLTNAYQADGFVVLKEFLSTDALADTRRHLARYVRDLVPNLPPMDVFYKVPHDPQSITMLARMSDHDAFFREMLDQSDFRSLANRLFGRPSVPQGVEYFNKPPGSAHGTPAHQDGFYFHLSPCEALTMWLPLDHEDEENGCVRYVRGSHLDGMRLHGRTEVLGFSQGVLDYGDHDTAREISACVGPGDLIVHDAMTIHRADPNRSEKRDRPALGLVYYSDRAQVDRETALAYHQQLERDLKAKGKI
ncbi:MAG: phytanoyl-CoA dioxygenase family protein [Planctomycetota bacterium]|nr:phytanoyl-CoA dioxygenase family protein [Planctomycetota bacterium]MDA1179966.1 phytanoyl-CoA dioxygenase family protein [Planctomycetota bacterium]